MYAYYSCMNILISSIYNEGISVIGCAMCENGIGHEIMK